MIADLNLLRLLLVLNETRQTVTAAKAMKVSQPTISVMLKKLRAQFNDELFIRNKNALEPTPKCLEVLESLPLLLDQMDNLCISSEDWHISDLKGEIHLFLPSPLMVPVGGPLIKKISSLAPSITVQCLPWGNDTNKLLENMRNGWGVSYLPMQANKTLCERTLGYDKFLLLLRAEHPLVGNALVDIIEYPLCVNVMPGYIQASKSEMLIKKYGIDKIISLRSNNMNLMLDVVKDTDFICITSGKYSSLLDKSFRCIEIPSELPQMGTKLQLSLFTHKVNRNHPFTDWLEQHISDLLHNDNFSAE